MPDFYSDSEPRPATISFIRQFSRVCMPGLTDKIISGQSIHGGCISALMA